MKELSHWTAWCNVRCIIEKLSEVSVELLENQIKITLSAIAVSWEPHKTFLIISSSVFTKILDKPFRMVIKIVT